MEKNEELFLATDLLALNLDEDLGLWEAAEEMIREIQAHFRICVECREAFDAMACENFNTFERVLSVTHLCDWICEKR